MCASECLRTLHFTTLFNILMFETTQTKDILHQLMHWGEERADVRAMILTSTRTNPNAPVDPFSDYDVLVVVTDIYPYFQDWGWLDDFGPMLVVYRDPIRLEHGFEKFAYITQYEDGLKIDFTLWPVELLQRVAEEARRTGRLEPDLDVGYTLLLDKDGLAAGMPAPTYRAYIPLPPDEAEYHRVIEVFFHEATYVAKHLWRDELLPAKYNLDYAMKGANLRRMLEWRIEIDGGWSVKTGAYGKGLKKRLPREIWVELEATYVGAGPEENWEAMFRTIALFRRVAEEVGQALGYAYPEELDRRMDKYLKRVKSLPQG